MGKIKVTTCEIEGLCVIEPTVFKDERGYFMETYNQNDFKEAGLDMVFVQDNQSMSTRGVLRGLHYQKQFPQGKLVRVVRGTVFDVAVDLRTGSKTYGKWFGVELSAENKKQFYIPEGFAHGFLVLSDEAEFVYKCTESIYGDALDLLLFQRTIAVIGAGLCDLVDNIHTLNNFSECCVSAIQMRSGLVHDEELRTSRVRHHGTCHRQNTLGVL